MKYGFILALADARTTAELARIAEENGWDGIFCWEPIWGIDPWISLSAAAMTTSRIRLGTMLTPVPRRRPWELANQTTTLDHLSGGRVTLSAGLGMPGPSDFWLFDDDPGRAERAQILDESLDLLELLWAAEPFDYDGTHFRARRPRGDLGPPTSGPRPIQQPRIPVWMVGAWPSPKSMRRVARLDGWIPAVLGTEAKLTPEILAEGIEWIRAERATADCAMDGFDIIAEGSTPADDPVAAAAMVAPWEEAGATWWLDVDWSQFDPQSARDAAERRLRAGPPTTLAP